ncbi:hypothetical protein GG344DRAFT_82765 [Lentinula edodes]|nr:hypothetical protein GG344DRAFT_82765 [Lentinula edodes]
MAMISAQAVLASLIRKKLPSIYRIGTKFETLFQSNPSSRSAGHVHKENLLKNTPAGQVVSFSIVQNQSNRYFSSSPPRFVQLITMAKSTGLVRLALSVMLAMTLLTVCLSMPIGMSKLSSPSDEDSALSSTSAADGGAPTSATSVLSPAVYPTPTAGSADSNSATASTNASASAGADNGSTSASASSSSEADTSSASSSASSSLSADAGSASASASASSSGDVDSVSASASVSSDNNNNGNSTAAASASTSSTAGAETGASAASASVKSLSSADSDSNSTSNAVTGSASPDSSSSSSSSPSFSASPATQNHDGVPPLMQPLAKTTKSENKTISDHQRWPSAVAAATIDGVVFPQTSKHPRVRAGQLSFMIGQKCKEMKENGYWSNVGDGLKKSFTVVPLILEAMVKTARN